MNSTIETYRGHEIEAGIEESVKNWKIRIHVFPSDDVGDGKKIEFKLAETFNRLDGALNSALHMVTKAKQKIDENLG